MMREVASQPCASTRTIPGTRADAERVFHEALGMLTAAAMAMDSTCAADSPAKAQILADLIEGGTSRLVTARRLFLKRAERL